MDYSYVYFALTGNDFDPDVITESIGIKPTEKWRKGDQGKYKKNKEYSCWKLTSTKDKEYIFIDKLVDEIVNKLFEKIEIIVQLKKQYNLSSTLEIVLYVDINEDQSTPALGHNLKTIEFLYKTQTETDIDIYRFNSL